MANLRVARTCFEYDTINSPLAVYVHDAREKLRDFCEAFLDAHWIACKVRVETPQGAIYTYSLQACENYAVVHPKNLPILADAVHILEDLQL